MNDGLIPMRYAKAIYQVALEKGYAAQMYTLMKNLVSQFIAQPDFQQALSNPFIPVTDKTSALVTATEGLGVPKSYITDVIKLLATNRRIDMTRAIADAYVRLYRRVNNICEVVITSAVPMAKDESERLISVVAKHLNGASMEPRWVTDSALIGGFSVSVGNERIDASISNQLNQLRLNLIKK